MTLDLFLLNDVYGYLHPHHTELFYINKEEYSEVADGYARSASLVSKIW
ncbi:MAG TPA: hypothetical protein VLZ33_06175 [Dysgonamonadaceae bacterium]|nr:hypothetical protein [Dysgonamonadaceae bacterium]